MLYSFHLKLITHCMQKTRLNNYGSQCRFSVDKMKLDLFHRYDFSDNLVTKEAEKVLNIIDGCIRLGLKWRISTLDLNTKIEYVGTNKNMDYGIDLFQAIPVFTILFMDP